MGKAQGVSSRYSFLNLQTAKAIYRMYGVLVQVGVQVRIYLYPLACKMFMSM